jgi:hypothetical protein
MRYAAPVHALGRGLLWFDVVLAAVTTIGCQRSVPSNAQNGANGTLHEPPPSSQPASPSGAVSPAASPSGAVTPGASASGAVTPGASPPGAVSPGASPSSAVSPGASPSSAVSPGASASGAVIPAASSVDFGAPGLAVLEPPLPPFEPGMMDHAEHAGWSADSTEFGYSAANGGLGDTTCVFTKPNGKATSLSDLDPKSGEPNAAVTSKLERKMASYVVRPTTWPYARDLVLTWEVSDGGSPTHADSAPPAAPLLRVGARVRAAKQAAWPIRISARNADYTIHPEAIALSPDARELAVLSHEFGGEYSDHFELRFVETRALASQAYNVGGLELHRAGAYAKAAELFRDAAALDPNSALPLYNLACALTRLGDPQARPTLERAIARGGEAIRQKALHDPDFDAVRTGWLAEVLRQTNH